MISGAICFVAGALAMLIFNRFFPGKVDKLTRETEDEINDRLRGD